MRECGLSGADYREHEMTIIAVRDGVIASDSLVCNGDSVVGETDKIFSDGRGGWFGTAGQQAECCLFEKWYSGDRSGPSPVGVDNSALCLLADGSVERYWCGTITPIRAAFYAAGCGAPDARAAMMAGAIAERAVEITIALDCYCGGPIQVRRI